MALTDDEEFRLLEVERRQREQDAIISRWRVNSADEFFQGTGMRMSSVFDVGQEALQLLSPAVGTSVGQSRGIIYFVPEANGFIPNPPPATGSYAQIGSGMDPAAHAWVDITAYYADRTAYSNFLLHSGATLWQAVRSAGTLQLWPQVDSNGYGTLLISSTSGGQAAIRIYGGTSDPIAHGAGAITYRTDTSKWRGYTSSWDNFAMESWVTTGFAPLAGSVTIGLAIALNNGYGAF